MEDALVQKLKMRYDYKHSVLILVLMEDALVLTKNRTARTCQGVS